MPNPIPQAVYNDLFPAVGQLILCWATFEGCLETWVNSIYHWGGGKSIDPIMPRVYKSKITFLKDSFKKSPKLAPLKDAGLDLLKQAPPLFQIRSTVAHGALSDFEASGDKVMFLRIDLSKAKDKQIRTEEWLTVPDIIDAGFKSIRLARASLIFGNQLDKAIMPE